MKTDLNDKLVEILTSIQSAAGNAGDFAIEQLPDIVHSYIMYGRIQSIVTSICYLMIGAIALRLGWYVFKNPWNISTYEFERNLKRSDSNLFLLAIFPAIGFFFSIISISSFDILVWVAPKVWLLKEIGGILK